MYQDPEICPRDFHRYVKYHSLFVYAPNSEFTIIYSAITDPTYAVIREAVVFALQSRSEQVTDDEILAFFYFSANAKER